jgi:hypothetical protein
VFTRSGRRRAWTAEQKARIIASVSLATAASPSIPLRKSTGRVATSTHATRRNDHRALFTAASTSTSALAANRPRTRTIMPATSISFALSATTAQDAGALASVTIGANAGVSPPVDRQMSVPGLLTPAEAAAEVEAGAGAPPPNDASPVKDVSRQHLSDRMS